MKRTGSVNLGKLLCVSWFFSFIDSSSAKEFRRLQECPESFTQKTIFPLRALEKANIRESLTRPLTFLGDFHFKPYDSRDFRAFSSVSFSSFLPSIHTFEIAKSSLICFWSSNWTFSSFSSVFASLEMRKSSDRFYALHVISLFEFSSWFWLLPSRCVNYSPFSYRGNAQFL